MSALQSARAALRAAAVLGIALALTRSLPAQQPTPPAPRPTPQPAPQPAPQPMMHGQHAAATAATPLDGAWRRVSATLTAPDTNATTTFAQPSVYLYTGGYYSYFAFTREPAKPLSTPATDAEKVAAFDSFVSQAGRYRVQDSTVTLDVLAARVPNAMGTSRTATFRVQGDTLVMTTEGRSPRDTTQTARTRVTYVRLP